MKVATLFFTLLCCVGICAVEKNPVSPVRTAADTKVADLPLINIEANAGFGYVLTGNQVKLAHDALTPSPDYYINYMYGGKITIMPSRLGVQIGFHRNLFRAASFQAGGGYSVYTYDTAEAGLAYAIPISRGTSRRSSSFLMLGAGLNYSMLQLADQFKSGMQSAAAQQGFMISFNPDSATGIGGYAQIGVTLFLNENVFLSVSGRINYINARYSGASSALDSWGLEIPLGIGVGF